MVFENTHILKWIPPWIDKTSNSDYYKECEVPALAVIDVSFISLENVLRKTSEIIGKKSEILALVKPQFEVGQKFLKKGIVKNEEARSNSITAVAAKAESAGMEIAGRFPCPVAPKATGKNGFI